MRAAFLRLDADYCSAAARNEASPDAGATALALVVEPSQRRIIVANCGDCAAVLSRNGSAVSLSKAHSPVPHSEEYERVISAGGWVTSETDLCVGRLRSMDLEDPEISRSIQDRVRLNEIHRVCGEVAVSSALGDVDFKGWTSSSEREPPCFAYPEGHPRRFSGDLLTAEPEIQSTSLGQAHAFVVLATDGLWDVLDGEEAVRVVSDPAEGGQGAPGRARGVGQARALRLGSGDNDGAGRRVRRCRLVVVCTCARKNSLFCVVAIDRGSPFVIPAKPVPSAAEHRLGAPLHTRTPGCEALRRAHRRRTQPSSTEPGRALRRAPGASENLHRGSHAIRIA